MAITYHITHRRNVSSILRTGLNPSRAKTVRRCVWTVTRAGLLQLVPHILARHRWRPDCVVVVRCDTTGLRASRWKIKHYRLYSVPLSPQRLEIRPLLADWIAAGRR